MLYCDTQTITSAFLFSRPTVRRAGLLELLLELELLELDDELPELLLELLLELLELELLSRCRCCSLLQLKPERIIFGIFFRCSRSSSVNPPKPRT